MKIAIIGISLCHGKAENYNEFWGNLIYRNKGDHDNYEDGTSKTSAYSNGWEKRNKSKNFDNSFFSISNNEASNMPMSHRRILENACEAFEDAGYAGERINGSRTGIFIGKDHSSDFEYMGQSPSGDIEVSASWNCLLANRISHIFDLRGPSVLLDTSCTSGLAAVHMACNSIRLDECDMALAGGICIEIEQERHDGYNLDFIRSKSGVTRIFDQNADGLVWESGAGCILLKEYNAALKDRDHIYAVILGSDMNNNGESNGLLAPNPRAIEDAMVCAWKKSSIDPEKLVYIEANGSGTSIGDAIEFKACTRAMSHFTEKQQFCGLGSVKGQINHLSAASGIAAIAKLALSLQYKLLPGMVGFQQPNERIPICESPFYIFDQDKKLPNNIPVTVGLNAFGFGGTNIHMVMETHIERREPSCHCEQYLLTVSAVTSETLLILLNRYIKYLETHNVDLYDFCYTLNTGRKHQKVRAAFIATDTLDLLEKLRCFYKQERQIIDNGIYYSMQKGGCNVYAGWQTPKILKDCCYEELHSICMAYIAQFEVNWQRAYFGCEGFKLNLPTYPFMESIDKKREQTTIQGERQDLKIYVAIRDVWTKVTGNEVTGDYTTFREIGGNSILAVHAEIEFEALGYEVSFEEFLPDLTVCELANKIINRHDVIISNSCSHDDNIDKSLKIKQIQTDWRPFNQVFYKYCFYNALFPILEYFGHCKGRYLCNDVVIFDPNRIGSYHDTLIRINSKKSISQLLDEDRFKVTCSRCESLFDAEFDLPLEDRRMFKLIEKDLGVFADIEVVEGQAIESVHKAIRNNRAVIVWVDSFYESLRKDSYRIKHWPHVLTVISYDEKEKVFMVIEHNSWENLTYELRHIAEKELACSLDGFLSHFGQYTSIPTIYEISNMGDDTIIQTNQNYGYEWHYNFLSCKDEIYKGVRSLRSFVEDASNTLGDQSLSQWKEEKLLNDLSGIINGKLMEEYQLAYFHKDYLSILEPHNTVKKWKLIRSLILKNKYAQPKTNNLSKAQTLLGNIICGEENFYDELFNYIRKYPRNLIGSDIDANH